ncbi:MAG: hypothetical protein N2D54_07890 [Chloroflexota bacterium]
MDSSQSEFQKRILKVVLVGAAAYFILTFVVLKVDVSTLMYEIIQSFIYVFLYFKPGLVSESVSGILLDLLLLVGGFMLWVGFFAQFVLPTHTIAERRKAINLVLKSLGEMKGPAIFIKNGEVIQSTQEGERKGAGVILLDSASSALLNNQATHTRAVGPGLVFTNKNERITNSLDLRSHIRILGPQEGDIVFEDATNEEVLAKKSEGEQNARTARIIKTSGLTRDGIQVVPNVIAVFQLDAERGDGNTMFGYREDSVAKAIRNEAITTGTAGDSDPELISWDWLPVHLAANLWREYLRKFTLNQLFDISQFRFNQPDEIGVRQEENDSGTTFDFISSMINARLKYSTVQMLNDIGEPIIGERQVSREFQLLQNHGIKIVSARVDSLRMKDEHKLIDRWKATWLDRAETEQKHIKDFHELQKQKAQEIALMEFSESLIGNLNKELVNAEKNGTPKPDMGKTLHGLLNGTRTSIVRNSGHLQQLSDERADLNHMIEWVQDYQNGQEDVKANNE